MTWLLLLACSDKPGPHSEAPHSQAPDSEDPGLSWLNPPEAEDLDPSDSRLRVALEAAPAQHKVGDLELSGYAYNGQTPGPTLRARLGDTLSVTLTNGLDETTTVHWHGLEAPWEMDGATWLLGGVEPGESAEYEFELTRAGTFWYHPHFDTDDQVDGGLYGLLIVEDPQDPVVETELLLVFDDWSAPDSSPPPPHGHGDEHGAAGAEGTWTVNGQVQPLIPLPGGQRVRARLLNASNSGYLDLRWDKPRQIGSDQGLLPALEQPTRLVLAPGDRVELEWLTGETDIVLLDHPYSHSGGEAYGDPQTLLTLQITDPAPAPEGAAWPFVATTVTPDSAADMVYSFSGDGGTWLINGETYPEVTVKQVPLGEVRVLEIRNVSGVEHPFHLHGMPFEVLSVNGEAPARYTLEDTYNLRARDVLRVRIQPPHAGAWMLHCHILEHEEGGMMTVLEVTE